MKRWIWLQICARRFFTRYNVWTISMRLHYDFHGGVHFFCMVTDFDLIVVMPKCLAARSPVARCIHFCIRSQLNWGTLIAATIFSGNSAFKSEFGFRSKHFGETPELVYNTWHSHHWSWWLGTILGSTVLYRQAVLPLRYLTSFGFGTLGFPSSSVGAEYAYWIGWGIWPLLILCAWFSGDFIEIDSSFWLCWRLCDAEQNFLLSIVFQAAGTLF